MEESLRRKTKSRLTVRLLMLIVAGSAVILGVLPLRRDRAIVFAAAEVAKRNQPGFDVTKYRAASIVQSPNGTYWRVRFNPVQPGASKPVSVVIPKNPASAATTRGAL